MSYIPQSVIRIAQLGIRPTKRPLYAVMGKVVRVIGLTVEVAGCKAAIGARCEILTAEGRTIGAEVVGFTGQLTYLMPLSSIAGIEPGAKVRALSQLTQAPAGIGLLGRVIGAHGDPLDGLGELGEHEMVSLYGKSINPLHRHPIDTPLDVGVKAINALLTIGKGQRIGLFAGSGVGKSVLLGMMTKFTSAEIVVVGLIGERGREVKEFIENTLGKEGMKRTVVIACPADEPPLNRLHAAMEATAIAEHFRDQGKDVLLLMDSLTRFAQAQREIALAVGEPPATKGYPPSVFAKLPQLVERAGNGRKASGSITAFYTVLTEGDDQQDPIADAARAILDGHIVLSRSIAEEGHYPAIDVEASISRVMPQIVSAEALQQTQRFKYFVSRFEQVKDLINVGAYMPGSDQDTDFAIQQRPNFKHFLQQGINEAVGFAESHALLDQVLAPPSTELAAENL